MDLLFYIVLSAALVAGINTPAQVGPAAFELAGRGGVPRPTPAPCQGFAQASRGLMVARVVG
jgi:hypothetical protein